MKGFFTIETINDNGSGMAYNTKEEFLAELGRMIDDCIANGGTFFDVQVDSDTSCFAVDEDEEEDEDDFEEKHQKLGHRINYRPVTEEEFRNLKEGDTIFVGNANMAYASKVVRPCFWNADADEPGREIETTNGFCDQYSVFVMDELEKMRNAYSFLYDRLSHKNAPNEYSEYLRNTYGQVTDHDWSDKDYAVDALSNLVNEVIGCIWNFEDILADAGIDDKMRKYLGL